MSIFLTLMSIVGCIFAAIFMLLGLVRILTILRSYHQKKLYLLEQIRAELHGINDYLNGKANE